MNVRILQCCASLSAFKLMSVFGRTTTAFSILFRLFPCGLSSQFLVGSCCVKGLDITELCCVHLYINVLGCVGVCTCGFAQCHIKL